MAQVFEGALPHARGRDGAKYGAARERLGARPGAAIAASAAGTGFKPCGFVELAADADRLHEYRRIAAFNRKEGVDVQEISAREVAGLFPLCRTDDVLAGFYVPDDGRVNPVDATAALAKGFRNLGGTLLENTSVADVLASHGRATGVVLEDGSAIQSDYVVNATGMWARQLGERHGICIPNQAAEHYYLVTDAMPEVDPEWPVVEDPASHTYVMTPSARAVEL